MRALLKDPSRQGELELPNEELEKAVRKSSVLLRPALKPPTKRKSSPAAGQKYQSPAMALPLPVV
eukprot:CAMPEP_0178416454 /NCGR_PEP_ID=MMETSP0689_2-20121128/24072_1 /TAXON_ID=160604 /ORGANISM="Amphidinium massartii, Strain CS-259" /LENGTH=64 /DNA_ID=CAMNT_0020037799 /DNA_START=718 /DNA_END=912 /DNA_ORIENTATION=+